jgi:Ca-activated chloride channel homolog
MKYLSFVLFTSLLLAQAPKQAAPRGGAKQAATKQAPPAAPAKEASGDSETTISLDVTRVNMLYTVSDKKGRFVSDLTANDFEIIENKKKQTILSFAAESDLPLRLAILVDTSNSIRDRFKFIQEAALDFINTAMRTQDKAIVVSFDTAAELVTDLTNDTGLLTAAVRGLRPGGGTALYDAIYFSCRDKLMVDQPREKYRRAIIILTDGEDNLSRYTREQAIEMAHKADVVIYAISTNISHSAIEGDKVLKRFAEETGGDSFYPFRAEQLSQSFENIANELRHQYNVLYRPDPLKIDGLYHAVDIRVKERKDLNVRARRGYYAPTPFN